MRSSHWSQKLQRARDRLQEVYVRWASTPASPSPVSEAHPVRKPEPSSRLCGPCELLNLGALLSEESSEQCMGFLSNFASPDCPFCGLIAKSIRLSWGGEDWDIAKVCAHAKPPPKIFLHSRSPLSVKRHGRIEHPQPRLLLAVDQQPENFQRNRPSLREIDRVANRFIIAEIEILPQYASTGPGIGKDECLLPRRHVGERVDPELVKSWLAQCKRHKHSLKNSDRGSSELFRPDLPFRLIDVIQECLVQKAERCDYIALSYVWGLTPTVLRPGEDESVIPILLSTQATIKDLSTPGSLSGSRQTTRATGRNPRTILDAMELTRQIGMRYLWVDTLCIIQNDNDDRGRLIGLMDDIYNNATLTFIAAAGKDSDAGLKGVSHRAGRPIEWTKITDAMHQKSFNLSLSLPSLCDEVRSSHWNTRGWTFQEQGLSQRCVYLTPEEIFFNCTESQWREGYDYGEQRAAPDRRESRIQIRTGPPTWSLKLRRDLDPTPYHYLGGGGKGLDVLSYQTTVQDYSRRNLTDSGDILTAFEGVFNRFKRAGGHGDMTTRQTQGIPVQLLYQALLWFPSASSKRRVCVPSEWVQVPPRFSTWSWASWDGPVEFVFADNAWLSRNISYAPIKRVPFHVPIACWYLPGSKERFWTVDAWKSEQDGGGPLDMKSYFGTHVGIDVDILLAQSLKQEAPGLDGGGLGFIGSYLSAEDFSLSAGVDDHVVELEVAGHRGQLRFDSESSRVDKLVAMVVADTITAPADTVAVLLGLCMEAGVSRRVAIGFIYYSRTSASPTPPPWKYTLFNLM